MTSLTRMLFAQELSNVVQRESGLAGFSFTKDIALHKFYKVP